VTCATTASEVTTYGGNEIGILLSGFILARVVRVKNENGRKFTRKKIMATGRPTRFKWHHRSSVTHSTLLHMRSKLVVVGE